MPKRPCIEASCPRFAVAKGRCDLHRREMERERSRQRRGGLKRGPYQEVIDERDARDRGQRLDE
jgi:hypothetical protein